jgi:hypothetical protein
MTQPLTDTQIAEILGHPQPLPSPAGRQALCEALVLALTKAVRAQSRALAMLWSLPAVQEAVQVHPSVIRALAAQTTADHELAAAWRLARELERPAP